MSNDQNNKKAIATHGNGFYSYPSLPKLYHIHAKKYRKTAILLASCQLSTVFLHPVDNYCFLSRAGATAGAVAINL